MSVDPEVLVEPDSVIRDTVAIDTLHETLEFVVPKRADELFDDFAFNFMRNRRFQRNRIVFPLRYIVDGVESYIARKEWHFDKMYSSHEVYTLIFDHVKGLSTTKDTSLTRVVVEELNLETERSKSYLFIRRAGSWRLEELHEQDMSESVNSEFYAFYYKFATDADYRRSHIAEQLKYTTSGEDGFGQVSGTISPTQWDDFAPELPTKEITNILYGQTFRNSSVRVFSIRSLAGGMECTLTFKRKQGEWQLIRLDN